jgi:hypothetical protein
MRTALPYCTAADMPRAQRVCVCVCVMPSVILLPTFSLFLSPPQMSVISLFIAADRVRVSRAAAGYAPVLPVSPLHSPFAVSRPLFSLSPQTLCCSLLLARLFASYMFAVAGRGTAERAVLCCAVPIGERCSRVAPPLRRNVPFRSAYCIAGGPVTAFRSPPSPSLSLSPPLSPATVFHCSHMFFRIGSRPLSRVSSVECKSLPLSSQILISRLFSSHICLPRAFLLR